MSLEEKTEPRNPFRQCAPDHTRVRMHISFDGTDFVGWQRQTRHKSVQGTLEKALSEIFDKPIHLIGASRTDAGVHAHQQVAHFDCPRDPSTFDLRYAIQGMTPDSIVVKDLFIAPRDFHAIAVSESKIYRYVVVNRKVPTALRCRYSYWVRFPLDVDFLNETTQHLVGLHDFKSFQSSGTITKSTIRRILKTEWTRVDEDTIEFRIQGTGFLKQMVRNIVGTAIDLNQEGDKPEKIVEMLKALDRRKSGPTAPAQGLFLERVIYPEAVDNACRKL